MSKFVADFHRLAEHCEFGATLDEMLRNFFVFGINKETILQKLLAIPNLDLAKAVLIASACMTTDELLHVITSSERNSQSSLFRVNNLNSSSAQNHLDISDEVPNCDTCNPPTIKPFIPQNIRKA